MTYRTAEENLYHSAAMMDFTRKLTRKEEELLRATMYRIAVRLGDKPMPASEQDIAANAYAARTMENVE